MDYTPKCIDEIVFHSETERQRINDIVTGKIPFPVCGKNGILLYGIYGTGKTTLARMLPEAIERGKGGKDVDYDFFACEQGQNGAMLMTTIRNTANRVSFEHSRYHYFVLDELDNLTDAAMASLKTVMGIQNTIFIMTTNHISKIDAGVKNRCVRINFNAAQANEWLPFARRVLNESGARWISDDLLIPVIEQCKGSAREIADAMHEVASQQPINLATST